MHTRFSSNQQVQMTATRAKMSAFFAWIIPALFVGTLTMGQNTKADMIEDFQSSPNERWEFISDQVMGGVSDGQVTFKVEETGRLLRLEGVVSTENNGGFIQARLKLNDRLPETAQGIEVEVRGNNQRYFIHARTTGTLLPWHYYQAPFDAPSEWIVVRIPFDAFQAEGWLLSDVPAAGSIVSLAVVAFGRDHAADVSIRNLRYY